LDKNGLSPDLESLSLVGGATNLLLSARKAGTFSWTGTTLAEGEAGGLGAVAEVDSEEMEE
jgi:hypothetical protein